MSERIDELSPETLRDAIETRRLVLRWPVRDDLRAISRLINDPVIAENTSAIRYPYPVRSGWHWLANNGRLVDGRFHVGYAVTLRANPRHIAGLIGVDVTPGRPPEIGYWLAQSYRRKGLASEAARALIDTIFTKGKAAAVGAWARTSNPASQRVLGKAGMRRGGYGRIRSAQLARYVPVLYFQISRSDWEAGKRSGRS